MHYRFRTGEVEYAVSLERHGQGYRATVDGESYDLEILDIRPGQLSLRIDRRPLVIYWAAGEAEKWISYAGCTFRLEKPERSSARQRGAASQPGGDTDLRAPMPAQVRAIQVSSGDPVEPGQTLMVLEAMKMEIRLQAPRRGQVARILTAVGQTVERDQVLIELAKE